MRSLVFTTSGKALWDQYADLCCSCGLCSLYACPEDLYPREACDQGKIENKRQGKRYNQEKPVRVHPIKEGRRVPLKQLMKKLDVLKYDSETPFNKNKLSVNEANILLNQHIGAPSKPLVNVGDRIKAGDRIAGAEEGKLGANIHSSIPGTVTEVTGEYIRIEK